VKFKPLHEEFGLALIKGRVSPEIALQHEPFVEKVREALEKRQTRETLTPLEKKRLEIYDRASLFYAIGEGNIPGWISQPEDPRIRWFTFHDFVSEEGQKKLAVTFPQVNVVDTDVTLRQLFAAFRDDASLEMLEAPAGNFANSIRELIESRDIHLDRGLLGKELQYHRLSPFGWAWKFYLAAGLLIVLGGLTPWSRGIRTLGAVFYFAAFLMHIYGFYLRCTVAGRPPVTNMYESVIWVSWATVFFSAILFAIYRSWVMPAAASFVATIALVVAEGFPAVLDPSIGTLVPVLRSNMWLTVHVLTITLSYGAFALAWGLGHAVVFLFAFAPKKEDLHRKFSQYLYRSLQIGVILLATGTVLGGVWASYSWGRFWGLGS